MSWAVANCQRDLLPWPERAKAAGGVKEALPLGSLAPVIACEPWNVLGRQSWFSKRPRRQSLGIYFRICYSLAAAAPPPAGVRRRTERKRQKLVGRDKGSLAEQQTKRTITTTTQIRWIHNTNSRTQRAALTAWAARAFLLPSSPQPEPSMMAHGMEYPVLFGQVGSACLAVSPPGFWWKLTLS